MYKILVGLKLVEHARVNNKKQAFDLLKAIMAQFNIIHLLYKEKVIFRKSKPKVVQQKLNSEIRGPKSKKLNLIDAKSIFNLEGL